jgi:hypothetical protein
MTSILYPDAPQVAINDIGTEEDFLAAIDATIKFFNDGDIVEGTIVKVDRGCHSLARTLDQARRRPPRGRRGR